MSRSSIPLGLLGLLTGAALLRPLQASNQPTPFRLGPNVPPMSGVADAPKTASPGRPLAYTLKDIGRYITTPDGVVHSVDERVGVRPISVRSFQPGSLTLTSVLHPSRSKLQEVHTFIASGTAQRQPGRYLDIWLAFNDRAGADPAKARPEEFVQFVTITRPKGGRLPASPRGPRQNAGTNRPLPAPIDMTERERLSAALKPDLLRRLTRGQRAALQGGQEVALPVAAMPPQMRERAVAYITAACQGVSGPLIQFDPATQARFSEFSLVIVPPPAPTLGVDSFPDASGSVTHF